MTVLLVLIGGALGAPVRYVVDLMVQSRHDSVLPWGTFVVNAGGVAGAWCHGRRRRGGRWRALAADTGGDRLLRRPHDVLWYLLVETVRLAEEGALGAAAINAAGSVVVGAAACAAGWSVATALL